MFSTQNTEWKELIIKNYLKNEICNKKNYSENYNRLFKE